MKYLLYFKPDNKFSRLILGESKFEISQLGLHTTLYIFSMNDDGEDTLIDNLSEIQFTPFTVRVSHFDSFDGLPVLVLSRPDELFSLHKKVVRLVEKYCDKDFQLSTEKYFGDFYNPHITIKNSYLKNIENKNLNNFEFEISEFFLAKKTTKGWVDIYKV